VGIKYSICPIAIGYYEVTIMLDDYLFCPEHGEYYEDECEGNCPQCFAADNEPDRDD
jgi:hypothetical protein